jgi:hypothetical protein
MNIRKVLIGTGVAIVMVTGTAVTVSTLWPQAPSYAAGVVAQRVQFGGEHGGWHRSHAHRGGRGMAALCSDRRDQKLEHGLAFVEGFVNFTPEQTTAWNELGAALREGSATIGETCAELETAGKPQTAPEKLARFEAMGATGLAVLQRVRPVFDRFYATLSEKQQKALDDLMSRGGRRS